MPPPGGTPLSPTAAPGRMEPLRRAVRDRADLAGATCSVHVFFRRNGSETGTRAIARLPAAEWAVAGCWERDGGRKFLGKRGGSQHANVFGCCSRDVCRGARQFGQLRAAGGFMARSFEVPALRPASS